MAIETLGVGVAGTTRPTFNDHRGAIRACWSDLDNNKDHLTRAVTIWVNCAKPGSSDKRAQLMFTAGSLFEHARLYHLDAEWFIRSMSTAINDI